MVNHRGGGSIGIGGDDHLITRSDAQHPQGHFGAGGLGIQADCPVGATEGGHLPLQLFCSGTGGDPAGPQGLYDLFNFRPGDIRGREGNIHNETPLIHMMKGCRVQNVSALGLNFAKKHPLDIKDQSYSTTLAGECQFTEPRFHLSIPPRLCSGKCIKIRPAPRAPA